jgi:hypothetical protein
MLSGIFKKAYKKYEWTKNGFYRRLKIQLYYNRRFFSLGDGLDFRGRSQVHGQGKIIAGKNLMLNGNVEF